MGRSRRQRRKQHGSAWHWKQTDCWYYTLPGTKKRMPLLDDRGQRIRGKENEEAAETALAKVTVANAWEAAPATDGPRWLVAQGLLGVSPVLRARRGQWHDEQGAPR